MKKITLFIIALFAIITAQSQTTTFTGAVNNDWNEPGNWTNGVPSTEQTAIINEGSTVNIQGPEGSNLLLVGGIQNSGTINAPEDRLLILTSTLNNNGTLNVGNTSISGTSGNNLTVLNTGTIQPAEGSGDLSISNASSISNEGEINTTTFTTNSVTNFTNQAGGSINTSLTDISTANFGNYGSLTSGLNIFVNSEYAFNNGLIRAENTVQLIVTLDYLHNNSKGRISSISGLVALIGIKNTTTGKVFIGNSDKVNTKDRQSDPGKIEMVIDTSWIVGDTASLHAETIRFVFDYLHIFDIDSIKRIYANSKIEFYGTNGSILNLMYNEQEDFIWVENGSIEIHSDSIATLEHDINYYFSPNPTVGPSDTTFTQIYVQEKHIYSDADSSGSFNLLIQNQSTADKSFDYTVSSKLGWVSTFSGSTQLLSPFQFDSLEINYSIPIYGDTLVDTIMFITSVPGVYTDTTYSYLHSYPSLYVSIQDSEIEFKEEIICYPVPFSNSLNITSDKDQDLRIFNIKGQLVKIIKLKAEEMKSWKPAISLPEGVYVLMSGNTSKKVLYMK